ncbi:ATP-binding protein [Streptomyces sp. BK340]|uniref:ATP-binding protein n=1 Tax=Streptomyces sp. BK340 TaxID=2572903 RepID=UPI00119F428C|nr:ATP-binding protein [Streptomyces sp. BK340]
MSLEPDYPSFKWETRLVANEAAGANARFRARPRLTVAGWPGDVDVAARIADKLVSNAAAHGKPFGNGCVALRLTVLPKTEDLLIEVDDADPVFPNFDAVNSDAHPAGSGLGWVKRSGAHLFWEEKRDAGDAVVGKTVKALVPLAKEAAA